MICITEFYNTIKLKREAQKPQVEGKIGDIIQLLDVLKINQLRKVLNGIGNTKKQHQGNGQKQNRE